MYKNTYQRISPTTILLKAIWLVIASLSLLIALSSIAISSVASELDTTPSFVHSDTPLEDVITAQEQATANDKLLLVVLGAQWCHDSTGLAGYFDSEALRPILQKHYTTIMVDVGLLEDRRDITQRFNYPTYYATPTVMIIEPSSGTLLNRKTMARWAYADSIPLLDYVEYFTQYAELTDTEIAALQTYSPTPQEASYNEKYAARLQQAYKTLSPLLKDDINGKTDDNFYAMWKEVRRFRATLQEELMERAAQQLDNAETSASGSKKATLTEYDPFSWQ